MKPLKLLLKIFTIPLSKVASKDNGSIEKVTTTQKSEKDAPRKNTNNEKKKAHKRTNSTQLKMMVTGCQL